MANKGIKGITIEIGGDTKGLNKALEGANNQSKDLQNELKAVERGLKFDPGNVELVRQKQELLTASITSTSNKLDVLRTAQSQVQAQFDRGDIGVEQYRAFQRELQQTEGEMNRLQSQLGSLGAEQERLSQTTRQLGTFFEATGTNVEQFSGTLGTRLTQAIRDGSASADQMERALRLMGRQALGAGVDVDQLREALRNADNGANIDEIRQDLDRLSDAANEAEEEVQDLSETLNNAGDKMTGVGTTLSAGLTAPIVGIGVAAGLSAKQFDDATAQIQSSLGVTADEAENLEGVARNVWKNGFGESLEEVANALIRVKQNIKGIADDAELERVTESSIALAKTFESDVNEVTRAGNNLMHNFGVTSEKAFDLMAYGAQNGLNFSNEMFDNLSEYSPLFSQLGFSAEEYFQLLEKGAKSGIYNLDYLNDVVKEFGIRIKDGSTATSDALSYLFRSDGFDDFIRNLQTGGQKTKAFMELSAKVGKENAKSLVEDLGKTGAASEKAYKNIEWTMSAAGTFLDDISTGVTTGKDAMQEILKEISKIEDPMTRAQMGVSLFGTKWEDLEESAMFSLIGINGEINNLEGTMQKITKVQEQTFGQRWESMTRNTAASLEPLGIILLDLAEIYIPKVITVVEDLAKWFSDLSPTMQKTVVALGGVAAAIGPVLIVGGALIGSIGAIGGAFAVLTGPIGLTVAGLSAVTIGAVALYHHLDKKGLPQIDLFGDKVSDSTQKAITGFVELNDEATIELNKLSWGGMTVTQEMADSITETFNQMGDQVLQGMQEDHAAQIDQLNRYFQTSSIITEEQERDALAKLDEMNAEQAAKYEAGQTKITEILNKASEAKRSLSLEEKTKINMIQQEMVEEGIKVLSDGELEFKTIMESMKVQSAEITAELALQTIDDARKTKNEVVSEAEKQYEDTIALIIRMRDESGVITGAQARQMIEEAQAQKDGVVTEADEMYSEVLRIAKEKGGEHLTENEIMLGKQLSLWDEWSIDITRTAAITYAKTARSFKSMAIESIISFGEIRSKGTETFIGMNKTIDFVMNDLPGIVKRKMTAAVAQVILKVAEFKQAGKDIVQGLINGMTEKIDDITLTAKSIGNAVVRATKNALKVKSPSRVMMEVGKWTGLGLAKGIEGTKSANEKVMKDLGNVLASSASANAKAIAKINQQAATEQAAIAKKSNSSIADIYAKAKDAKRKLTSAEVSKIAKIEDDADAKILANKKKNDAAISKLQSGTAKDRLDAIKQFIQKKNQLEELSLLDEVAIWKKANTSFKSGSQEKIEAQIAYRSALEKVNAEITSINETYSNKMKSINDKLIADEKSLNDAYNTAFSSRIDSIMSFAGLFDEFSASIELTGSQLLSNLQSQVTGLVDWRDTLDSLWGRIDDQALMEELEAMGPKALGQLKALNSLTDTQLSQYSNLFRQKAELARLQAEEELAGMKEDTAKRISELRETAKAELDVLEKEWVKKIQSITKATDKELLSLKTIGKNAGQGLLDGLTSMEAPLIAKAREIANAISSAIQSALDIHSPSRVMKGFGINIGQGLIVGMDDMLNKVSNSSQRLSDAVSNAYGSLASSSQKSARVTSNSATNTNPTPRSEVIHSSPTYQFNFDASNLEDMQRAINLFKDLTQAHRSN